MTAIPTWLFVLMLIGEVIGLFCLIFTILFILACMGIDVDKWWKWRR